jgi:cysteine desulfurase
MIYFDNAATTPTLKEAEELFLRLNGQYFGNPSSSHAFGREANRLLEEARKKILSFLKVEDHDSLLFTSGATESNNLAIKGTALHYQNRGRKIITSAVEHPSILNAVKELQKYGFEIVVLPVNSKGQVERDTLKNAMDGNTILVSIMAVNNEVGSINDLQGLSEVVHTFPKALFHVDATQAIGKISLPYEMADLLSFSGHKFGAFKGCGGLVYKSNIVFEPLNSGGEQEKGFRAGTVNMPAFVSMAAALEIALRDLDKNYQSVGVLQGFILQNLLETNEFELNSPRDGLPYVLNLSTTRKKASVVLEALSERGIFLSSVSACSSKGEPVSYVLTAIGKSKAEASNSLRLSFSPRNTLEEAKTFMTAMTEILHEVHDR